RTAGEDLQLAFLPLLLAPGPMRADARDRDVVRGLRGLAGAAHDPKAEALERLLADRAGKTIVFVQPRATVRYLLRRLRGRRVAAVIGDTGLFGDEPATRAEVLAAFEQRLATKLVTQAAVGAAQLESVAGPEAARGRLDWCDRLQRLQSGVAAPSTGTVAAVAAQPSAVVLIVRVGSLVEALVVTDHDVRPDPGEATRLLEEAACARPV